MAKVKELKKGEFFTLREIENPNEKQVWVKGEYDRSTKKYECFKFSDVCDCRMMDGNKQVFTEFTF